MRTLIPILALGFIPFIAHCSSPQQLFSADTINEKGDRYTENFEYPKTKKQFQHGYIGLGIAPADVGLTGFFVFNPMAREDKVQLFQEYKTMDERFIHGPRRKSTIFLNQSQFLTATTPIYIGGLHIYFPYIPREITFTEEIVSEHNEMNIKVDKRIKFDHNIDARKNRLDRINTDIFIKNNQKTYKDQAQLKISDKGIYSLGVKGGCLSSAQQGKIKELSVFMTEVGKEANIKNLNILQINYQDPAFHTSFIIRPPIKIQEVVLMPKYKQHKFKLVCMTTKGKQLSTEVSYSATRLPRLENEY